MIAFLIYENNKPTDLSDIVENELKIIVNNPLLNHKNNKVNG